MDGIIVWSPGVTLESAEKEIILYAFRYYRGNKTVTAQALGISIRTLDNKFEKYQKEVDDENVRKTEHERNAKEFLERQRNGTGKPTTWYTPEVSKKVHPGSSDTATESRVEPSAQPAAKPALSVPKRAEVQGLPPASSSKSHSHGTR